MVIELIHNHADQHQNEVVLSFDQSLLSSFSLFLLPSFHLNFEALVPRVGGLIAFGLIESTPGYVNVSLS